MSDKPRKRRIGRPPKSGAYSPVCREEFLEEYPEIRSYVQAARDGLVQDQLDKIGGKSEDDLSAAQVLLIDRLVSRIALSRQIEVYLRRHGILRRDSIDRKVLDAEPICQFWLQLQNSIDRASAMLGIEIPRPEASWDPIAEIQKIDEERAKEKEKEET